MSSHSYISNPKNDDIFININGDLLHRSIVPGFGDTPETGRLTQVFFFDHDEVI